MSTTHTRARVADFPEIRKGRSHRIDDFITDVHRIGHLSIDRYAADDGHTHYGADFATTRSEAVSTWVFSADDAVSLEFRLPGEAVSVWLSAREARRLADDIRRTVHLTPEEIDDAANHRARFDID